MSFLPFYDTDNDPNFTKLIPKIKDFTSKLNSFNFDFKKFNKYCESFLKKKKNDSNIQIDELYEELDIANVEINNIINSFKDFNHNISSILVLIEKNNEEKEEKTIANS